MCSRAEKDKNSISPILINVDYLNEARIRLSNKDSKLKPSFNQLINDAEAALLEGPFSVTDKTQLPPSGNKHDYASYSRYWWPDPSKTDGLPYLRRDGETNPESQSLDKSDRPRIGAFGTNTETLGLAYYLTGDERYARKAAELLRTWFLDLKTRMNPNVNHAQVRPGHNTGTKSGILDGRLMVKALEGSLLISRSEHLKKEEYERLKAWASDYLEWLTNDEMALQESRSKNNHGSYYDAQAMYFALYAGEKTTATRIAKEFSTKRLSSQIMEDGSMPEEMARTRPLFYSIYNLHAMMLVAHLAEKVNIDLWKADQGTSQLRSAANFLAPYADPSIKWPQPTLGETDRMELLPILKMASYAYSDQRYMDAVDQLPLDRRQMDRSNLVYPLMR